MADTLANTITPLTMLGCWQLLFGNAIIGLIEAWVVARFLASRRSPTWIMIGANYFSMLVGWMAMSVFSAGLARLLLGDVPILHVNRLIAAIVLATLVVSILLEWPFVHAAFSGERHPVGRSLAACTVAQLASYALVLIPCWATSNVLSGITIAPVAEVSNHSDAAILFIGNDGDIYRAALDGSPPVKHMKLGSMNRNAVLTAGLGDEERLGLWLWQGEQLKLVDDSPELVAQLRSYAECRAMRNEPGARRNGQWRGFAPDPRYSGLDLWTDSPHGQRVRVAVSTPFFSWDSRCASLLPGDRAVFEMNNHILLVDLQNRRVALVTMGRSPVVLGPE